MKKVPNFLIILALTVWAWSSSQVLALPVNTVVVSATVLPARYIFVDQSLNITKVVGNTSQAIQPMVVRNLAPGQTVPMTPKIAAQYKRIQATYGPLLAGKTYYPPSGWRLTKAVPNFYISRIF